jgi:hypothetical protein
MKRKVYLSALLFGVTACGTMEYEEVDKDALAPREPRIIGERPDPETSRERSKGEAQEPIEATDGVYLSPLEVKEVEREFAQNFNRLRSIGINQMVLTSTLTGALVGLAAYAIFQKRFLKQYRTNGLRKGAKATLLGGGCGAIVGMVSVLGSPRSVEIPERQLPPVDQNEIREDVRGILGFEPFTGDL